MQAGSEAAATYERPLAAAASVKLLNPLLSIITATLERQVDAAAFYPRAVKKTARVSVHLTLTRAVIIECMLNSEPVHICFFDAAVLPLECMVN